MHGLGVENIRKSDRVLINVGEAVFSGRKKCGGKL